MTAPEGPNDHPTADTIARYLDGTLPSEARLALERHLNTCASCRDELVETRGALRTFRRQRWLKVAAPLAAAAGLALLIPLALARAPAVRNALRSGGQVAPDRALQAIGVEVVAPDSVRFVWSAPANHATFVLTVTDSAGSRLLEVNTSDTMVTLSRTRLGKSAAIMWFVDALFADGQSAKTEIRQLRLP